MPAFSAENILNNLRRAGLRITPGRRRILDVLFQARHPLSLEEIRDAAGNKDKPRPDYATVFRMVALLEKHGIVRKVNLQRPCSYYELQDPSKHYDHLVCTGCGQVVVLTEHCPLGPYEQRLSQRHGFRDIHHSLEFFGRCPKC